MATRASPARRPRGRAPRHGCDRRGRGPRCASWTSCMCRTRAGAGSRLAGRMRNSRPGLSLVSNLGSVVGGCAETGAQPGRAAVAQALAGDPIVAGQQTRSAVALVAEQPAPTSSPSYRYGRVASVRHPRRPTAASESRRAPSPRCSSRAQGATNRVASALPLSMRLDSRTTAAPVTRRAAAFAWQEQPAQAPAFARREADDMVRQPTSLARKGAPRRRTDRPAHAETVRSGRADRPSRRRNTQG